jgi:hypothetical protein
MSGAVQDHARAVSERLAQAMNAHHLEAQLACFHDNYRSEQPAHPARTFTGRDQVRQNWSKLFESIPDFQAEILRVAVVGNEEWAEWIWQGTKEDGTPWRNAGCRSSASATAGSPGPVCIWRRPNAKEQA